MRSLLLLLPVVLFATGCGPDCQSSCDKLFGDQGDQCNIQIPDTTQQEMLRECVAHCDDALARNGEVDGYDPNRRPTGAEVSLENEKQAALWMDCIAETSCDLLKEGICAPTQNFP